MIIESYIQCHFNVSGTLMNERTDPYPKGAWPKRVNSEQKRYYSMTGRLVLISILDWYMHVLV